MNKDNMEEEYFALHKDLNNTKEKLENALVENHGMLKDVSRYLEEIDQGIVDIDSRLEMINDYIKLTNDEVEATKLFKDDAEKQQHIQDLVQLQATLIDSKRKLVLLKDDVNGQESMLANNRNKIYQRILDSQDMLEDVNQMIIEDVDFDQED